MDAAEIAIRAGTVDELDRFADFWLAMFEEIGTLHAGDLPVQWRANFANYLRKRIALHEAGFFVAHDGNEIVGTAGGLIADGYPAEIHSRKRGYIFGVCVLPEFRRRGLAEQLTARTVAFLHELGCATVRLHASQFGRKVYERLGFVATNEMELRV